MRKMAHLKLMNIYLYKRMLNVQRIVLLLLYVTFTVPSLAEVATMQLPQLSLNLNNATRREVFNTIEKNTKYVFIYSDELLTELNEKVSIHVNKQTLDKILDKVLHLTSLGYKITNRQITVSKKAQTVIPKTPLKITGHVTDEKGEALIGVNIQEEGTNNVVITDMDGNFSIYNVSGPSSVLQFTYIGFAFCGIRSHRAHGRQYSFVASEQPTGTRLYLRQYVYTGRTGLQTPARQVEVRRKAGHGSSRGHELQGR